MSGNTFGKLFTVTTFGESHGPALGGVVDGCPPGLPLAAADLQVELARRRPGQSRYTTQRRESDTVEILSGVFEGKTTGTPIGLLIRNEDARTRDYARVKTLFRPGHADYTYTKKYGVRDYRGGGRASARETAIRVAAGAIAKKYLSEQFGVAIRGCIYQIGALAIDNIERIDWAAVAQNAFFVGEPNKVAEFEQLIHATRKAGDSIGAGVLVEACGMPVGWGEPIFDRLDADIAKAMLSINAAKAVEIGDGFAVIQQRGSQHRDEITPQGFASNHAGGVLGGISSGQDLRVKVAFKPTSSIQVPGQSIDDDNQPATVVTTGRHDPCVGIRAVPIVEAMLALVLIDHALRDRGQNADIVRERLR